MTDIPSIKPFGHGEHLVGYASFVAHHMFDGVIRDTGLPYTQDHLANVATLFSDVTVSSRFQNAGVASAWLHDGPEDVAYLDVFDPFGEPPEKQEGVIYLNDLLAEAGEEGQAVCFMVNLMTHRPDIFYQGYVDRIFSYPEQQPQRDLHVLTSVLKMADRRMNINPDERRNVNELVGEYIGLDGSDTRIMEAFYRRTKTIDAFRQKGLMDVDVGLFVETLMSRFRSKQRTVAIDNLSQYLPLAERRLLVEIGENNGIFHWRKFRDMLKGMYIDSLRLYAGDYHEASRLGIQRSAPDIPGYTSIHREIRDDVTRGVYEI